MSASGGAAQTVSTTTEASIVAPGNRPNYPDLSPPVPPRTSSGHRSRHSFTGPSSEKKSSSTSRQADRRGKERSTTTGRRSDKVGTSTSSESRGEEKRPASAGNVVRDRALSSSKAAPRSQDDGGAKIPGNLGSLAKEPSTIVNQLIVSDPGVDSEREQARQAGVESPGAAGEGAVSSSGGGENVEVASRSGTRSRHDYNGNSNKRKDTNFGQYILGQTLGEGEFGKVKLGWKKDGSVQVAIKMIRREVLGSNPSRLPKIYREISILRGLSHPNIVRLHEMVETDRHIGIIMEYASGGELFDYILNNRYLKDNPARRLFAQLVSGVGYLHKKGIVHRDLKLENLLLDRNRNIIITDFGFANTFDPDDQLDEEVAYNLSNRDYVKRMHLDETNSRGMRRGDLMQTSCGSPCYAAPELVVSDSLYTGRKVDVWSCGVILVCFHFSFLPASFFLLPPLLTVDQYAMLAGYLPFDDDPANPDGDNINLLYKYIVTTSLTFPEYVTPHARDLLRRILVPDPRKRADLFEVARHSWLSEYSHVVSHVTSSTTKVSDIARSSASLEQGREGPMLTRSVSVREAPKAHQVPIIGGLSHQQGDISQDQSSEKPDKTSREAKRRTVQLEYVAPPSQTTRTEPATSAAGRTALSNTQARVSSLPSEERDDRAKDAIRSSQGADFFSRSVPETSVLGGVAPTRPATGGSMASFNRLSASYGQPAAPKVEATNAHGRLAQPKQQQQQQAAYSRPSMQQQRPMDLNAYHPHREMPRGHRRSSTVSSIGEKLFGRPAARLTSGRTSQSNGGSRPATTMTTTPGNTTTATATTTMRPPRRYTGTKTDEPRVSMDSRRSFQFPRPSDFSSAAGGRNRRMSFFSSAFPFRSSARTPSIRSQTPDQERQMTPPTTGTGRAPSQQYQQYSQRPRTSSNYVLTNEAPGLTAAGGGGDQGRIDEYYAAELDVQQEEGSYPPIERTGTTGQQSGGVGWAHISGPRYGGRPTTGYYDEQYQSSGAARPSMQAGRPSAARGGVAALQNHRKFTDAYEHERGSGAARKVMDFFRRRAKSRAGEDQ